MCQVSGESVDWPSWACVTRDGRDGPRRALPRHRPEGDHHFVPRDTLPETLMPQMRGSRTLVLFPGGKACRVTLMFSEGYQRQTNADVHCQKKMVKVFNIRAHVHKHTYIPAHKYTCTHIHMHALTSLRINPHTCTQMPTPYTWIHTHTHACGYILSFWNALLFLP